MKSKLKIINPRRILEELTGQKIPFDDNLLKLKIGPIFRQRIGYSQLNEILLYLGYDRISHEFFQFLVNGQLNYNFNSPTKIDSVVQFKKGVERFQKIALLKFGNIKHAFKLLSKDASLLNSVLLENQKRNTASFSKRSKPIINIKPIPKEKTYLLGYIIQREINDKLKAEPINEKWLQKQREINEWKKVGIENHYAYLTSDHLDVYVATSMREEHEFLSISKTTKLIFGHKFLKKLNLRYFDPTQAYCLPRIDKGLSEALMLKRAKCTIYLIQESDTLGKDSELASTLAQGKPVIAYIPNVTKKYFDSYLKDLKITYKSDLKQILINQIKLLAPELIWDTDMYPIGYKDLNRKAEHTLKKILFNIMKSKYDRRANTLKDDHPLGIQVHLENGVANGVLVVRTIESCVKVLFSILMRDMKFSINRQKIQGSEFLVLREKISNCIFRVVTSDEMLTNSYWNFYL